MKQDFTPIILRRILILWKNGPIGEFKKGIFTIQQPAIRPLYNTRAFEDSLMAWMKVGGSQAIQAKNFYDYIKKHWQRGRPPGFWENFLKTGFYQSRHSAVSAPRLFRPGALNLLTKGQSGEKPGGRAILSQPLMKARP